MRLILPNRSLLGSGRCLKAYAGFHARNLLLATDLQEELLVQELSKELHLEHGAR